MKVTAIVLTYNEERHIERCLESLETAVSDVLVVDSYSTDQTVVLAQKAGARVLQNPWINHATQFNWALTQLPQDTDWVLRLDADEYVNKRFARELRERLPSVGEDISGIIVDRYIVFSGKKIQYGGVLPLRVLRVFRYGRGRSENRWMDEHIIVDGEVDDIKGEIIDNNLNSLTWWTAKHNQYASKEAVEQLNLQFKFMPVDMINGLPVKPRLGGRRWVKERIYSRLPSGLRAFAYFFYRYVLRLGFLDGRAGAEFHFLQGFWYRYLVDAKVQEVLRTMRKEKLDVRVAIEEILEIKV